MDNVDEIWLIYSTFAQASEAISTASALLEKKLIACANIQQHMLSLYRWEGRVTQQPEVALLAKTQKACVEDAIRLIKEMHAYTLPSILAWPVQAGYQPFLHWVADESTVPAG